MKILNVTQGSPEWAAARAKHFTASEAPAMMGVSKYMSRAQLMRQKASGIVPDVDAAKQRLFDRGHETEAMARPIVEDMIGEDLFPVTATDDKGYLLASFDGLTMGENIGFEHKLWNESVAAQVRAGELSPLYYWQLEQQLLVSGAEKIIFVCSDGTRENFVSMEYRPVPGRAEQLIAGWAQFAEDLKNYHPVEVIPATVAEPIRDLPALSIEIAGRVVASNLVQWKEIVTDRIAKINTDLQTDQHFADAAEMVKFLDDGEKKLDLVKSQAQSQASDIDTVFRAIDDIKAAMRAKRLELDKLVTKRKDAIREEIVQSGKSRFADHVATLNTRLGKPYMPLIVADFAGAIKGKRTIQSMHDAVDTLLASKKIEANEIADRIHINLTSLRELAADYPFLFADTPQIVLKQNDDLVALVKLRVAEHKESVARQIDSERERKEAEEKKSKEQASPNVVEVAQVSTPTAQVAMQSIKTSSSATPPAIWQKARDAVAEQLDELTISELAIVGEYINRKSWIER